MEQLTRPLPKKIRSRFKWYKKTCCDLKIFHGTREGSLSFTIAIQCTNNQTELAFLERLFATTPKLLDSLSLEFHQVPAYLNQYHPNTSLLITQDNIYHESLYTNCLLRLPNWIELTLPLDREIQEWQKKNNYTDICRRIRKNKLSYRIEAANDHLEFFYHRQFRPYIHKRHGQKAFISDFATFTRDYADADILTILDQDETPIAAAIITHHGNEVRLCRLGVLDADPRYTSLGAIGAVYYFSATHYSQLNLQRVNFGLCSSFLKDPVTHYKIRLCGRLNPDRKTGHHLIIPLKKTPALTDFMVVNPMIVRDHNKLTLLCWDDDKVITESKHPFYKNLPIQTKFTSDSINYFFN